MEIRCIEALDYPLLLREPDVFAGIHLEIQRQRILGVRFNDFFIELHEDRVFAKDCVFVHRLKIDGDEEWPVRFGVDPFPAFDAKDLGNFQKLHPGIHHHRFHAGGRDLGLEFVENDMMNHEGKANRRFQGAAQVRIHISASETTSSIVSPELMQIVEAHSRLSYKRIPYAVRVWMNA